MMLSKMRVWCIAILLVCTTGCAGMGQDVLTVRPGERMVYRCEGGERIVARYYSLSDDSLDFVKVALPGGREVTLPRALSGSGVRYTNDVEWVWWTKGDSAFAETRTPNGEWQTAYKDCRQTAEKR